jgi:hypothetical protein
MLTPRSPSPSDIERVEVKFSSVQAMHVARLMDKSLPKRDRELFKDLNFLFELVSGAVAPEMGIDREVADFFLPPR